MLAQHLATFMLNMWLYASYMYLKSHGKCTQYIRTTRSVPGRLPTNWPCIQSLQPSPLQKKNQTQVKTLTETYKPMLDRAPVRQQMNARNMWISDNTHILKGWCLATSRQLIPRTARSCEEAMEIDKQTQKEFKTRSYTLKTSRNDASCRTETVTWRAQAWGARNCRKSADLRGGHLWMLGCSM